jgi:hypothetical protein
MGKARGPMAGVLRLVFGTVDLPDEPFVADMLDRFHAAGGRAIDIANVRRRRLDPRLRPLVLHLGGVEARVCIAVHRLQRV